MFLSVLAITGFFVFPRIPDVTISEPYLDENSEASLSVTGVASIASPEDPFVISFIVRVNVTVESENYIDCE